MDRPAPVQILHHPQHIPERVIGLLWRHRKPIALLLSMRVLEFTGNLYAGSALIADDNALYVSPAMIFHDTVTVCVGSFLLGSLATLSNLLGDIIKDQATASVTRLKMRMALSSCVSLALLMSVVSLPFYRHADSILGLSISNSTVVDQSASMVNVLYDNGVTYTFHLNWALNMISSAFRYDVTYTLSQLLRFVYIVLTAELWIRPIDDPDDRLNAFARMFSVGYVLPIITCLLGIFLNRMDCNSKRSLMYYFPSSFKLPHFRGLRLFFVSMFEQIYRGFGSFTGIAPSLLLEYLMVAWFADRISDEALAAMQTFILVKLVLLLAGNAIMIQTTRESGEIYGSIRADSDDTEIRTAKKGVSRVERAYLSFSLVMGLLAAVIVIALANVIRNRFVPSNQLLADRLVWMILMLSTTAQIINDCTEGLLNGMGIISFKAITTPIGYGLAGVLGWCFAIALDGGVAGLCGGIGVGMLFNSILLILYTHDKLPCRSVAANIGQLFFSARQGQQKANATELHDVSDDGRHTDNSRLVVNPVQISTV